MGLILLLGVLDGLDPCEGEFFSRTRENETEGLTGGAMGQTVEVVGIGARPFGRDGAGESRGDRRDC